MSELIVYGHSLSQPYRSVISFCELSGIKYEVKEINFMAREQRSEEYTKINPFQEFPEIVHDGFNLWESPAIIKYLANVYDVDNQWYPKDIRIRGRIDAYLHWHHENVRYPIFQYYREKTTLPYFYNAPALSPEKELRFKQGIQTFLETFNWLLSSNGNVAQTSSYTIADIFAYNEVFNGQMISLDISSYPHIDSWYKSLSSLEVLKSVTAPTQVLIDTILSSPKQAI